MCIIHSPPNSSTITAGLGSVDLLQGSELAGWADGRYSFEGIDLNHNFPDLNNIMWDAQENAADKSKVSNHYIPIPEYYTQEDATVRRSSFFNVLLKIT